MRQGAENEEKQKFHASPGCSFFLQCVSVVVSEMQLARFMLWAVEVRSGSVQCRCALYHWG